MLRALAARALRQMRRPPTSPSRPRRLQLAEESLDFSRLWPYRELHGSERVEEGQRHALRLRVAPLDIIVLAGRRGEDVHHHVAKVEQRPGVLPRLTAAALQRAPELDAALAASLGDGIHLRTARHAEHHPVVAPVDLLANIDDLQVARLGVVADLGKLKRHFARLARRHLVRVLLDDGARRRVLRLQRHVGLLLGGQLRVGLKPLQLCQLLL
mmetsp:Transcript_9543/g.29936  ORF Transcript_9543/g.29936 Transcript_9543/m.29936 type:complete len:213 (-) Transcript_9543:706-1344(-)